MTGIPVSFNYLHGHGIYGIIVDMDTKQYSGKCLRSTSQVLANRLQGLGKYLSEIDPLHRDSTWHLQRIIVFCKIHFQRTILKCLGSKSQGTPLWSRMMSLLEAPSEEDYDQLIDLLISITTFEVLCKQLLTAL